MSDSVWYYAQNDQERGPVSTAELRSLAATGKLRSSDLVWKEGMEVWTAASQVKGLMPEAAPSAAASDSASRARAPAARDSPRETGPREAGPRETGPREARWIDGPPAEDAAQPGFPRAPAVSAAVAPGPVPTSRVAQTAAQQLPAGNLLDAMPKYLRIVGIGLTAVGLLLVLAARGCDTLADRYTARVIALASVEQERFQQEWNSERRELEAEIERLNAKSPRSQSDQQLLLARETELQALDKNKGEEQRSLSQGRWADLRAASATAADDNRAWGFWRSILFVFGTLVLVPGLLVVSFVGQGTERWICLAMLGVVVFSLYMGEAAWTSPAGK